jgi:hypothetical protein
MQYVNLAERGYGILDVSKTKCQMDYYYMDDIEDPNSNEYFGTAYFVNNNETCANEASGFSVRPGILPIPAPEYPFGYVAPVSIEENNFVVFGAYPNPAQSEVTFQFYLNQPEDLNITVYDLAGKQVYADEISSFNTGVNYAQINISNLASGTYTFIIESETNRVSKKIIKR